MWDEVEWDGKSLGIWVRKESVCVCMCMWVWECGGEACACVHGRYVGKFV